MKMKIMEKNEIVHLESLKGEGRIRYMEVTALYRLTLET